MAMAAEHVCCLAARDSRGASILAALAAAIDGVPDITAWILRQELVRALEARYRAHDAAARAFDLRRQMPSDANARSIATAIRAFALGHDGAAAAAVLQALDGDDARSLRQRIEAVSGAS
jgi:phage tail sheath gpL-like